MPFFQTNLYIFYHISRPAPIKVRKLDSLAREGKIDKVDLIKIDVEGCELDVLKGATETLARFKPVIFFECNPRAFRSAGTNFKMIKDVLQKIGYETFYELGDYLSNKEVEFQYSNKMCTVVAKYKRGT